MPRGLWTTTVGSFPKPPNLEKARNQRARGEISADALEKLEHDETVKMIRRQEEIGLDILVDGELYRGDMTTYFAELMPGFAISNPVRSYGNRYYRKPIALQGSPRTSSKTAVGAANGTWSTVRAVRPARSGSRASRTSGASSARARPIHGSSK